MGTNKDSISGPHRVSKWQQSRFYSMLEVFIQDARSLVLGKPTVQRGIGRTDIAYSWLVFKIVDIIRYRAVQHRSVIATGILTNLLVIISVLSAFPWIRKLVFQS